MLNRRTIFLSIAGLLGSSAAIAADEFHQAGTLSDEDQDEIFISDAEPDYQITDVEVLGLSRQKFNQYVASMESGKFKATWADDHESIDYAHIKTAASDEVFYIDSDCLESLILANRFGARIEINDTIVFGLRGCEIVDGESSGPRVKLREKIPDHLNFCCIIGSWNRPTGRIDAFRASTVPNAIYMEVQRQGLEGCNLLPTGLHIYEVGTHGASFAPLRRQPGALRQISPVAVLRARKGLKYTNTERWDFMDYAPHYPSDNVHAGVLDVRSKPPYFSSKGCQVLPGSYSPLGKKPSGTFAKWRVSAGLSEPPALEPPEYGRKYPYLLLTGREARLIANRQWSVEDASRLRFGSEGEIVTRLRKRLSVEPGEYFDRNLMVAWIKWQLDNLGWADGIVWPEHAKRLSLGN